MRFICRFSLVIAVVVAMFAPPARAWNRVTYTHGSACQPHVRATNDVFYTDMGVTVNTDSVDFACPAVFSQEKGTLSAGTLQSIIVYIYWYSVPTTASGTPFNPNCRLYMTTTGGTDVSVPLFETLSSGTADPAYVFQMVPPTLPLDGTYTGASIYCAGVPTSVGISGIRTDACFPATGATCPAPPPPS